MNNSALGIAMADFFSVLTFGFIALINLPDTAPMVHQLESVPPNSVLIRKLGNSWQEWEHNRWLPYSNDSKDMLLISCTEHQSCLRLFNAQSIRVEQMFVALPPKRKVESATLFFDSCSVEKQCDNITIVHTKNSINLTKPKT